MNPILAAGLLIGVLCGVWTFVMGLTGWYKDPVMLNAFFLVIVIEIGGLIWGLRRTAAEGRTYSGQVVAGTLISIVAGVVIIGSSLLFTMVVYPDYFIELNAAQRELMQRAGRSEAEIAAAIDAAATMQTPMSQAMAGFFGTFVTGVVASAIIAVWIRTRRPARA
ncbi:MAG: DUF4199 domain-containing protein [Vicinamibacterales bacterium]